jgi:aerobic-type carbon monoxide dehydrogenase small subunit (CoxS/CutS family)
MTSTVVNSKTCEISEPGASLLAFLQSDLGLTQVKPGCGDGACGACTVLMNDVPVLACQIRAGDADLTGYLQCEGERAHCRRRHRDESDRAVGRRRGR